MPPRTGLMSNWVLLTTNISLLAELGRRMHRLVYKHLAPLEPKRSSVAVIVLMTLTLVWGLVEIVLGALAGAWVYRE